METMEKKNGVLEKYFVIGLALLVIIVISINIIVNII